ncbi:nitroreductase family protein [Porphyromonas sp.]
MSLRETLQHRRAIRYYDPEKPLDSARVEECLRQATLAPTSSNMQLYRCYHITDPTVIAALTPACLGQSTISTAKEVVVFAITPSRWRERVDYLFPRIVEDIHKHQPEEKWAKYEAMQRE